MALLTALTSLRQLHLYEHQNLPACLPALTWPEQLAVHWHSEEEMPADEELSTALPHLQNLTCLSIQCNDYQTVPPAVAGLPRLQRLWFDVEPRRGAVLSLPQGPWLASIRWLGLPWELARQALGTLRTAAHLEYLCVLFPDKPWPPNVPEGHLLWVFAATHPPLRCLAFAFVPHHVKDKFATYCPPPIYRQSHCHPAAPPSRPAGAVLEPL